MTDPDTPPTEEAEELPRHTTPTWEMELLISGAAVFAMLKFPGWINAHLLPLLPNFGTNLRVALSAIHTYLICVAVILAVTFILHLLLRAHWIALVGMQSVFPDGVRWEQLRFGPVTRETLRRHGNDNAAKSIERADNRSTLVFAIGVTLALTMLVLCAVAVFSFAIAVIADRTGLVDINAIYLFFALLVLILLIPMTAAALDRRFGHRLRPGNVLRRMLSSLLHFYARVGVLGASHGYSVERLVQSHIGTRRYLWLAVPVMTLLVLALIATTSLWSAPLQFGSYAQFPDLTRPNSQRVTAAHYNNQRDPIHDPAVPYIQSEVITGPYLRLVLPYVPARDATAMRRNCPAMGTAKTDKAQATIELRCLGELYPVTLDGKPLTTLHYDVTSDPRTRRPALQAMIDVRALAPGRHVLHVGQTATTQDDDAPTRAWNIVFWR